MKLYIAGPMTGLPEFNYPAFAHAEQRLQQAGFETLNPARRPADPSWTWVDYMRPALRDVTEADGLALLPGWQESRGAKLEVDVALALDLICWSLAEWLRPGALARVAALS